MTLGLVGHRISTKLTQAFNPSLLEVIDESHQHAGHAGSRSDGESHFRVRILAESFRGKSRVEQHRMVNAVLAEELRERVHALAIQAGPPVAAAEIAFVTLPASDPRLLQLLAGGQLPVRDLENPALSFIGIVSPQDVVLACGGIEMRGDAALLRSIAIAADQRSRGYGTAITFKLLAEARNRGAIAAYLLTTSAADFFGRLGFEAIDREGVPPTIAATSQFSDTACASAQPMVCFLRT